MKRFNMIFCVLLSGLFLYGCLPSLRPLYTNDTIIFDEALLGKWYEKGGSNWSFIKEDGNMYSLRVYEIDPGEAWFEVHLVKVGDHRFIDLYPGNKIDLENTPDMYSYNLVPAHTFMKLDLSEPNLLLRWINFFDLIDKSPEILKHERIGGNSILITARPDEIQRALIENLDMVVVEEETVFQKCPIDFTRVKTIFDLNLLGRWESEDGYYLDIVPLENRYDILYSDSQGQQAFQGVLYNFKDRIVLGIYAFTDDTVKNDMQKGLPPDDLFLIECDREQLQLWDIKWDKVEALMNEDAKDSSDGSKPNAVFLRVAERRCFRSTG